ncbi:MAG: GerW family sporulation protein [Clostridia bacterium]|nr:GerW family sporulation protein [Clostridia bacterium]
MENKKNNVQGVMDTAMQNIKDMVDVNTVVGDPITAPDGTMIIPVSKVGVGFASGGSDFSTKNTTETPCFGGGSGAGITISPIAFLVVSSTGVVSLLPISQSSPSAIDQIVGSVPGIIDQVKGFLDKKGNAEE